MVFGREYRRAIATLGSGLAPEAHVVTLSGVGYSLDRLGWLQFEQLCTRLLELEGACRMQPEREPAIAVEPL